MGAYINLENRDKEDWLNHEAEMISENEFKNFEFDNDDLPVVLVNNGYFTAAGIAYSKNERDRFNTDDGRFKVYFKASKEKLYEVSDLECYLKKN